MILTEAAGGNLFLLRNFIFYFEVFQKYSNSTVQFLLEDDTFDCLHKTLIIVLHNII